MTTSNNANDVDSDNTPDTTSGGAHHPADRASGVTSGVEPTPRDHHTRWSRGAPARTSATVLLAVVLAVAVYELARLVPAPAGQAVAAMLTPKVPALTVALRVGLFVALVLVAGIALLRPVLGAGPPPATPRQASAAHLTSAGAVRAGVIPKPVRLLSWVATGLGIATCLVGSLSGQSSGLLSVLLAVLLIAAALHVHLARRPATLTVLVVIGLVLTVIWVLEFATVRSGVPRALDAVYALAATVLLGASVYGQVVLAISTGRNQLNDVAGLAERIGLSGHARVLDLDTTAAAGSRRTSSGPPPQLVATRLAGLALSAGAVCSVAGLVQVAVTGPRTWFDLFHGSYGAIALAQGALPLVASLLWLIARRRPGHSQAGLLSGSAAAAVVLAVALAATLATVAAPPAAPVPGQPLLRPVALGGQRLALLVTPMRPGLNLVHLGDASAAGNSNGAGMGQMAPPPAPTTVRISAGGAPVSATPRPGAPGRWAVLNIPSGTRALTITTGASSTVSGTVPVNVGSAPGDSARAQVLAGPDGPECASATLGALTAGATPAPGCPSQQLTAGDAASLTDTVALLAHQRITSVGLIADGSARSVAADSLVRAQAARWHLGVVATPSPHDTVLVVSGWAAASAALRGLNAHITSGATGGVVLAPWLATAPILNLDSSETIPLTFDPKQQLVREYTTTLSTVFPGETPSPAGFLAWAAHTNPAVLGPVHFYGAAQVNVPMGPMDDMGGNGAPGDWYPGGTVVAIS